MSHRDGYPSAWVDRSTGLGVLSLSFGRSTIRDNFKIMDLVLNRSLKVFGRVTGEGNRTDVMCVIVAIPSRGAPSKSVLSDDNLVAYPLISRIPWNEVRRRQQLAVT